MMSLTYDLEHKQFIDLVHSCIDCSKPRSSRDLWSLADMPELRADLEAGCCYRIAHVP